MTSTTCPACGEACYLGRLSRMPGYKLLNSDGGMHFRTCRNLTKSVRLYHRNFYGQPRVDKLSVAGRS